MMMMLVYPSSSSSSLTYHNHHQYHHDNCIVVVCPTVGLSIDMFPDEDSISIFEVASMSKLELVEILEPTFINEIFLLSLHKKFLNSTNQLNQGKVFMDFDNVFWKMAITILSMPIMIPLSIIFLKKYQC